MIVMKFGGTSVADAAAMRRVTEIIQSRQDKSPVIVVSAVGGLTDNLVALSKTAVKGDLDNVKGILSEIRNRHQTIINDLQVDDNALLKTRLDDTIEQLQSVCEALSYAGNPAKDLIDELLSIGEYLSSNILAAYMDKIGMNGIMADARDILVTDSNYGSALPKDGPSTENAKRILLPLVQEGKIPVMQGFIGRDENGKITTLGRGGSDYSASLVGAMIGAEAVEIWTDVSGVLTADPSLLPEAKRILLMSFDEAAELAYFGAKVLHPSTMLPAVAKGVPVYVLNSMHPEKDGTKIAPSDKMTEEECVVKSIAYKEALTVITVHSTRMLMAHGFMASIFNIFEKYKTAVDLVSTSEVSVSITIDSTEHLDEITQELNAFAVVNIAHDNAIVCLVGENLKRTPGMPAKIFNLVDDVHIHMISQGASEINLSFVINESDLEKVIKSLHNYFFGGDYDKNIFADNN